MQARLLVPSPHPRGEAKIALTGVAHRYGNEVAALKEVTLDIAAGEFVCLLGPSGCGKSTLLYALAGHVTPSGGRITIDGKQVAGPSPERLLVFQEPALFPWLTARQNLAFALRAKGLSRRKADARAMDFLKRVQLQGFEGALPHQLSGGMQMRVSLARALAMDPAVLLMDEPFGALDAQTRADMHRLLQSVWTESRKTVVFVTHDVREALVLGDRVVVLAGRPGRVLQDLQVKLPRPRDPDDEVLVTLSRHVRQLIRTARQEESALATGEVHRHAQEHPPAPGARRVLGALAGGVGPPR
ncbi:MAG: ABC transporter ATP-binding protein [Myxococcaceae bacterium]|nr:ABC transporter ATP-binding protein [Myxococcaceae bacterium]MCI0671749.1 ABC transporter ATP-binding protein [Myxococcaceae bacterium]